LERGVPEAEAAWKMATSRMLAVGLALVVLVAVCVGDQGATIETETELSDEQQEYYRGVFNTYDMDGDGFITMEENIEQDRLIAEEQGKPFDESHSVSSFERTDLDKDGKVSLEEIMAPRPPEEQCKQLYGEFAEFDGVKSCKCMVGYTADVNGRCIEGSTEVCVSQFGEFARFDEINNCLCQNGTIPDTNGTCIKGDDQACASQFGSLAIFDVKNSTCVCSKGSVPDTNGTCVTASNELCMDWFGPNTAFDGENSCVCKKGFVYADGECFRGTNKVCGSIIAGSTFDGVNNCKCRKGYHVDETRGMCTRDEKGEKAEGPPLPTEGTVTVTIEGASHLPKMDKHTKCDPFAVLTLGDMTKKTKVVKKTYTPEWGETFVLTYNVSDPKDVPSELEIEFFDWDQIGNSGQEFFGKLTINLQDIAAQELEGWQDLQALDGSLVKGFDKKISAANVKVTFKQGLPYVPFWEPILLDRPQWALDGARAIVGVWMVLGVLAFFVFKAKPVVDDDKKEQ